MSLEAWGDEGAEDSGYTSERVNEIGQGCFIKGFQFCREMMARFVEQGGDATTAQSIRANWSPAMGDDPGKINDAEYVEICVGFDPMSVD